VLRWAGTRDNGTLLPAGRYRITARFTDSGGYSAAGPVVTVDLDPTVPGTVSATRIANDRWQVVIAPRAGAGVTEVAVSTPDPEAEGPGAGEEPQPAPFDPATGTYRTVVSLSGRPPGGYPLRALITRGTPPDATTYTTEDHELVVLPDAEAPVVTSPAESRMYLATPDQYAASTFGFVVSDQSSVTSSDFVVSAADGTLVDHTIAEGGEGRTAFTWDGTGPDGARLPAGEYVVRTTFTDALGNATSARVTVHLDDTVPGTLAVTGVEDNRFTFELTPTPGVTVGAVGLWLGCCGTLMELDPATGRYRVTLDLDGLAAGTYSLAGLVAWETPGAAQSYGYFWTGVVEVSVTH